MTPEEIANWQRLVEQASKDGRLVTVKDLKVGDRVMGKQGKWRTVTEIHPFGHGQKWLYLDNNPDGAYANDTQIILKKAGLAGGAEREGDTTT